MPTLASERLEATLRVWESLHLDSEIMVRGVNYTFTQSPYTTLTAAEPAFREIGRSRRYRHMLLDNSITTLDARVWPQTNALIDMAASPQFQQFSPNYRVYERVLTQLRFFPQELFAFTRQSRRVYKLNPWLQQALMYATFPDSGWDEVLWPFDAFAIELPEPIIGYVKGPSGKTIDFDCMLIAKVEVGGKPQIHIRFFSREVVSDYDYGGLNQAERRELRSLIDTKARWNKIVRISQRGHRRVQDPRCVCRPLGQGQIWFPLYVPHFHGDGKIQLEPEDLIRTVRELYSLPEDLTPEMIEHYCTPYSQAAKIAVGLAFYLESVSRGGKSSPGEWVRKTRPRQIGYSGLGIITDEAHVCEVLNKGLVDPSAYEAMPHKSGNRFARPHWRKRHRRRPAGSPPNASKTIKVPPQLINPHLVPIYGIIGGTTQAIAEEGD